MTCHQCRQKTLGKHTSCSCCNSLQVTLYQMPEILQLSIVVQKSLVASWSSCPSACTGQPALFFNAPICRVVAWKAHTANAVLHQCSLTLQGVLCGDCLFMRYGENILEVKEKDEWTCPVCRGLCNCSNHRIRRGWAPTGSLYRHAIAEGKPLLFLKCRTCHSSALFFMLHALTSASCDVFLDVDGLWLVLLLVG